MVVFYHGFYHNALSSQAPGHQEGENCRKFRDHLEAHRIARTRLERRGRSNARQRINLARGQIAGCRVYQGHCAGRLVAEGERGRRIRAAGAAQGAGGQVLARDTLGLNPGNSQQIGF